MISNAHRMWANGHFYFKLQILIFVKLWATGPKFNNGCGGPVPCDMMQWATWPGGGVFVVFAYSMRAYRYMLLVVFWGNDSRRIYSSGNVCLLRMACNARITHRYSTTHCMGCMLCKMHDTYTTRGVTCFVQWPYSIEVRGMG